MRPENGADCGSGARANDAAGVDAGAAGGGVVARAGVEGVDADADAGDAEDAAPCDGAGSLGVREHEPASKSGSVHAARMAQRILASRAARASRSLG
jgi:hypothetical protein